MSGRLIRSEGAGLKGAKDVRLALDAFLAERGLTPPKKQGADLRAEIARRKGR